MRDIKINGARDKTKKKKLLFYSKISVEFMIRI
jgi:ribosome-associated protein YbcJ (S4-like RNA binding protein)